MGTATFTTVNSQTFTGEMSNSLFVCFLPKGHKISNGCNCVRRICNFCIIHYTHTLPCVMVQLVIAVVSSHTMLPFCLISFSHQQQQLKHMVNATDGMPTHTHRTIIPLLSILLFLMDSIRLVHVFLSLFRSQQLAFYRSWLVLLLLLLFFVSVFLPL